MTGADGEGDGASGGSVTARLSGGVNRMREALRRRRHWQGRITLWAAAALIGAVAVGFAWLANRSVDLLRALVAWEPLSPWVVGPLGLGAIVFLTRRWFRGAEGSGIPQTIYALARPGTPEGDAILSFRVMFGRIVLASAALLCGASIGREGPTVHVGAALAYRAGRWMPQVRADAQRRVLILAGGAAGVAAAFNTPLAGIVFGIEELSRSFEERASGTTLTAVLFSGVVAIALVGNYTYFGQPPHIPGSELMTPLSLIIALVGGLAGGLFARITLASAAGLPGALGRWQRTRPVAFAVGCGAVIALIGTLTGGRTWGTGYLEARAILETGQSVSPFYALARAAASLVSFLSGAPAGLLAPSLSVGAGLGEELAGLFSVASRVPFAILGMAAYLAGVTQAPITSFVIVSEMTGEESLVLPLILTAVLANWASKRIALPLYQTLAARYSL